ncbi:M23 family metallopeptidase [Microcella pacifica]|uniref:M23 family metallopeptidase n=1 Tax=Microcella pacifica TaxID=2591847 RepID=UPI00331552BE
MRSLLACVLAVLLVAGGHAPGGTGAWTWPVEGPRVVLRPFLAPPTPYGAGHRGADLAATASGVPVRAATSGVVHFAGVVVDRPLVTIRSGALLVTVEPVDPVVREGDRVEAGETIGTLLPGHCARTCVHLGVRLAGEYVSPLLYLGGLQRAVLLPLEPAASATASLAPTRAQP